MGELLLLELRGTVQIFSRMKRELTMCVLAVSWWGARGIDDRVDLFLVQCRYQNRCTFRSALQSASRLARRSSALAACQPITKPTTWCN
jgi:hypothetical protein